MTTVTSSLTRITIGNPMTRGAFAVFPLFAPSEGVPSLSAGNVTTSTEGLSFSELPRPTVSQLRVTNNGSSWVLLLAGTILRGGYQNRMVETTSVLQPCTTSNIATLCVERGRWKGAPAVVPTSLIAPPDVRTASLPRGADARYGHHRDAADGRAQDRVWQRIEESLKEAEVQSPTRDLTSSIEWRDHHRTTETVRRFVGRGPLSEQIGISVAVGDQLVGIEIFGSRQLLCEAWERLIASYLSTTCTPARATVGADATLRILRAVGRAQRTPSPHSGEMLVENILHRDVAGSITSLSDNLIHAHLVPAR